MRSIISFMLIVIVCTLLGCSYVKNVQLLVGGELRRQEFVQAIPFELRKDLIVVKARVSSDSLEREFIFDTGAFNSKIEKGLADALGLITVTTKSNATAAGITRTIEVTRIDSIFFGQTAFYNVGAGKVVYDEESASPCIASGGIIGANILKLAHWKINYKENMIYFSDQPFEVDESALKLVFDNPLLSGTPSVSLKIDGKEAKNILFDVGYNGGLVLPLELANRFSGEGQMFFDKSTTGIYGAKLDTLIEKYLEVEIAGLKETIPVNFSGNGKALLGNEFLKHFDFIINYEENMITLFNKRKVSVKSNYKFIPGILDDTTWIVNRVSKDIPLNLGDTLIRINEKTPADLFEDHCDYTLGIKELISADSLHIMTTAGEYLIINNRSEAD